MVCSIGSVKMTVMARILASGGFQQAITAEKAGRQKLVCQHIQKELHEADDANLIDEEDMHVFDLNPMTDHLHLVCCNSCKKPVKASHFLAHAERCSSLGVTEELLRDLDSSAPKRKPPKKERKKIAGNHATSARSQERVTIVDASESAVSTSQLDDSVGLTASCPEESKDTPGAISGSVDEMIPLTKRPKLVAAVNAQASDIRIAPGAPAPLASKTYYPQRNNRLKAAINFMYHQSSVGESSADERESQGNLITWEASAKVFSVEQSDDRSKKKHSFSPNAQNVDQFIQSSVASSVKAECQPYNSSMDQFIMTDAHAYTSQVASLGARATKFQSRPYSFTDNSGQPLRRIQQANGTVHVL